jgi:beta-glucosidase
VQALLRLTRFAFGSDRGDTTWRFGEARLRRRGAQWAVRIEVTHTGERRGREAVPGYVPAPGEADVARR